MRSYLFRSERLLMRNFVLEDAVDLYRLNSDPEVLKYTGDVPFHSLEEAQSFIQNYQHYSQYGYGRWVVLTELNEFLGWCGLRNDGRGKVDLGFRFLRKYWGQGFGTESSQACIRFGFEKLGLDSIIGRTSINNPASIRVLEKLKMEFIREEEDEGMGKILLYEMKNSKL